MSGVLTERLKDGGTILCAEGYMWEVERRGFLALGNFLPEVVLERPSVIRSVHEEFVFSGSDVVEAFTYYAHRGQMARLGRNDVVEKLNRDALRIAREVADEYGKLMAGNISNTPLYVPNDPVVSQTIYDMYKEQIVWAVQGGADYIIGETHSSFGEAEIALKAIKEHGQGLQAAITMTAYFPDKLTDEIPVTEACRRLEAQGAAVVGINCARGPDTMLPLVKEIQKVCKCPVAALPVPYRCTEKMKTFYSLTDPNTGKNVYPADLDCVQCSRNDIRRFAEQAKEAGIQYIGLCCGNSPHLTREVAEVYGKNPPSSKYRVDFSQSALNDPDPKYAETSRKKRLYMLGPDAKFES